MNDPYWCLKMRQVTREYSLELFAEKHHLEPTALIEVFLTRLSDYSINSTLQLRHRLQRHLPLREARRPVRGPPLLRHEGGLHGDGGSASAIQLPNRVGNDGASEIIYNVGNRIVELAEVADAAPVAVVPTASARAGTPFSFPNIAQSPAN